MQPLISIITVTYNASDVLEPTMQSVASQTFKDYEHIVVDGDSDDSTLEVAHGYDSPRLRIFSRKDNGIYHGMNRGLKLAKGKYVLFLNAGDRFASPVTLARYAGELSDNPDIVYGDTVIVDNEGNILRRRHLDAPEILTVKSYLSGMLICHQAFMVKKEIAPKFSRNFRLSADYEWCIKCIAASGVTGRRNLHAITIHYLDNGLSQKRKVASLKERFVIMRREFGLWQALKAHVSFIPRAIARKF